MKRRKNKDINHYTAEEKDLKSLLLPDMKPYRQMKYDKKKRIKK